MSDRETVLRAAMVELYRVGLKITELSCHPKTMIQLHEDGLFRINAYFKQGRGYGTGFYCGIPVRKDASVELPEKNP
jgi:hypothetical protein